MFTPMPNDTVSPSHPNDPNQAGDLLRPFQSVRAADAPAVELCEPAPETPAGTTLDKPTLIVRLSRGAAVVSWSDSSGLQRRPIHQQSVWFVPAGVPHSANWLEPAKLLRVRFEPSHLLLVGACDKSDAVLVRLVDLERMYWNLAMLSRQVQATCDDPTGAISNESAITAAEFGLQILACLIGPGAMYHKSGLAVERFESVGDFIEANITIKFSRETLARADGQSLHHFARMFKQRIGLTPRQYIDRRRCSRAREMIEQGRNSPMWRLRWASSTSLRCARSSISCSVASRAPIRRQMIPETHDSPRPTDRNPLCSPS